MSSKDRVVGRLRYWALGGVISYLILELVAFELLGSPKLPMSYLLEDSIGFSANWVVLSLAVAILVTIGAEGLLLGFAGRERAQKKEEAQALKGIERSQLNTMLSDSSQNFVEVFPLKTGALNIYGAISKEEGIEGYRYVVIEPELTKTEKAQFLKLREFLIEQMDIDLRSIETREKAEVFLESKVARLAQTYGFNIPTPSMRKLQYYFVRDFIHLGKIEALMLDPQIEDISCDGAKIPIYIWQRDYESIPTNLAFDTDKELDTFVSKLAYVSGKHISLAAPMVDASLQDGSRLHLTYGKEITQRGSTFTIRKFKADPFTIIDLIKYNTVNAEVAAYLWYLIEKRLSMLVAGSTASGKTTSLNALSMFITPGQKVISVEDSVTGNSEVLVSEGGTVRKVKIGEYIDSALLRGNLRTPEGHELSRPEDVKVLTADQTGKLCWSYCTALIRHKVRKEFIKITTRSGRGIEVTADHSLFTLGESGDLEELSGKEISVGKYLAAPRLIPTYGRSFNFDLEELGEFSDYWFKHPLVSNGEADQVQLLRVHATHGPLSIPSVIELNENLALLSGLWLADGFYGERTVGFSVGGKDMESRIGSIVGPLGLHVTHHSDGISLLVNSKPLKTLFQETLELTGDDYTRHVPDIFFSATDRVVASLLRGYFTGDGNVEKGEIYVESASRQLLLDVQTLLLRFGILLKVGTKRRVGTLGGVGTYRGAITGTRQVAIFTEKIGFEQPTQMSKIIARPVVAKYSSKYYLDPIPLTERLQEEIRGEKKPGMTGTLRQRVNEALLRKVALRDTILELAEANPDFKNSKAYTMASSDYYFDSVVSVERSSREEYVYDLSVPETGKFVANNLICHNTPELSLPHENWIQEVSRSEGSAGEITLFDLVRNSLRQRPDVIIVGEIRGKEAFTLFQAISTGHGGMSTIHADSVESIFNRLTTEPMSLPRSLVGTSLDCIVLQLKLRLGDRSVRRIVSVNEILGYDNRTNEMVMNEVYRWDPVTDRLAASGRSRLVDKINMRYGLRPEEIRRDLDSRKVFLEWLASKNIRSYKDVAENVREFYANPYALSSRARTELEASA